MTLSIDSPTTQQATSIPTDLKLKHIIKKLPREVFLKDSKKAWTQVVLSISMVILGYVAIAYSPWYLLPVSWFFTGTALTGFFVIGHDGGHRSFAKKRWVNDLVGHIFMLPLIYPFHAWRILHNYHHKHTNKLLVDNAWQPWLKEDYANLPTVFKWAYQGMRGKLWWLASVLHWGVLHFRWNRFSGKEREQVRFSALLVIISAAIAFPTMIYTLGVWGFVKYWFIPWLGYHFWMSTFTIVHHTIPEIPFKPEGEWNEAEAQLAGTVHCDYPRWVEILCHDINVHVPHHISTAIPAYNLRKAHQIIKENWPTQVKERKFTWEFMKEITDNCHLYDEVNNYQSFRDFHASNPNK